MVEHDTICKKGFFDVFNELNTFEDFLAILKKHPYYGSKTGRDVYFAFNETFYSYYENDNE